LSWKLNVIWSLETTLTVRITLVHATGDYVLPLKEVKFWKGNERQRILTRINAWKGVHEEV
jgi:hypothetical protein